MSTTRIERTVRCWDDCKMAGCPTHVVSLTFQTTSSILTFEDGRGDKFYGDPHMFAALVAMLADFASWRGEIEKDVLDVGLTGTPWCRTKGDAAS